MPLKGMYLRRDVIAEPLIHQWYAWSLLLAPATAAMLQLNLHVRVLESWLRNPALHRRAVNESAMRGGMVLDYDGDAKAARLLLEETKASSTPQREFVNAVRELSQLLTTRATGSSLGELYALVPPALRGYVELVYDLQHRASIRFIEPLLYSSPLYDDSQQSIALSVCDEEQRPFVLSTPRFAGPESVSVRLPFRSPELDVLYAARDTAIEADGADLIQGLLPAVRDPRVRDRLFTREEPALHLDTVEAGIRVRYFGHATVLLQTAAVSILIDPLISYPSTKSRPFRYTLHDLPECIDFVLLTHAHQDHLSLETLLSIRHRVDTIVVPRCGSGAMQDPSMKLMLRAAGFRNVVELDELERLAVPGGEIMGVPFLGEHGDLDIRSKLAYCVRLGSRRLLFLADSNALEPQLYSHLAPELKPIDALYVGLECDGAPTSWLYGPLFTQPMARAADQSRRLNACNSASAMRIIEALDPPRVYVYAMAMEPWLRHVSSVEYTPQSRPITESNELVAACRAQGRHAERLFFTHELQL